MFNTTTHKNNCCNTQHSLSGDKIIISGQNGLFVIKNNIPIYHVGIWFLA